MIKVGGKVYQHSLLVSLSSLPPYSVAAKAIENAPVAISGFLPDFRRDKPRIYTATPLERQIMRVV